MLDIKLSCLCESIGEIRFGCNVVDNGLDDIESNQPVIYLLSGKGGPDAVESNGPVPC